MKQLVVVLAVLAPLALPVKARAFDPVSEFVIQYLAGKVVDGVWDAATGKPDVNALSNRLKALEEYGALRDENLRKEIRTLREKINADTTRDDFLRFAGRVGGEFAKVKKRLDDLEERVEVQEVRLDDQEKKTENAKDSEFWRLRAMKYRDEEKLDKALACFNVAIRLGKGKSLAMAHTGRAKVYGRLKALEVALLDADKAVEVFKGVGEDAKDEKMKREMVGSSIFAERAAFRLNSARNAGAKADATEAIKLNPKEGFAYQIRGLAHINLAYAANGDKFAPEKYAEAVKDAEELIALAPKSSTGYYVRGSAHLRSCNYALAVSDLTKAIEIGPDFSWHHTIRAMAYRKVGENDKAAADEAKAKELRAKGM